MRKSILCLLLAVILVLSFSGTVTFAAQPDRTFTYEDDNTPVPSTNVYQVKIIIDEAITGTDKMKNPTDIYIDHDDNIYILDAGNSRVLVLDKNYKLVKELREFTYNGEKTTLAVGAQGLFYREENQRLYIADTENNRVIVTALDGTISKIFEKPVDELLNPATQYKPKKIIVDNMGIMYITSANINTGALLVDSSNQFLGFYGTNKLKETAGMKVERIWRTLFKKAMSSTTYQPVEFYNMYWSEDRFVYTVSPLVDTVASSVSKLNALGNNIFTKDLDYYQLAEDRSFENMILSDITVDKEGAITILETSAGRLYHYDEGCNLLAVFGGYGYQEGLYERPVAIESDSKNNLYVLDQVKNSVTVLEQTFYGQMIRSANYLFNQGLYEDSIEPWMEVLRMNANYTPAYMGLGKAYISMCEYETAMDYFKLGQDKEGYAEAKAALRDERIRDNFGVVAVVVIVVLIAILFYEKIGDIIFDIYWKVRKGRGK